MNGIGTKMKTWALNMLVNIPNLIIPFSDLVSVRKIFSDNNALSLPESLIKSIFNSVFTLTSTILSFNAKVFDDPGEESMNCSDPYVNDNYNVMTEKIRKSGDYIELCSWLSLAACICNLIQLIYKIIYELILQKNNDYNNDKKYKYKIKELNEELLKKQNKIIEIENP